VVRKNLTFFRDNLGLNYGYFISLGGIALLLPPLPQSSQVFIYAVDALLLTIKPDFAEVNHNPQKNCQAGKFLLNPSLFQNINLGDAYGEKTPINS
jgi:hypothetical protein